MDNKERKYGQQRADEGHVRLTAKAAFFYVYNRMVASTNPGWIQSAFDTLTGIFERVGLRKKIRKIVGMV